MQLARGMAWAGWRISRADIFILGILERFRGSQLDIEAYYFSKLSMRYAGLGLVLCVQIGDLYIAKFCGDVSYIQHNMAHDRTSLQVCQSVLVRLDERIRDGVERT